MKSFKVKLSSGEEGIVQFKSTKQIERIYSKHPFDYKLSVEDSNGNKFNIDTFYGYIKL